MSGRVKPAERHGHALYDGWAAGAHLAVLSISAGAHARCAPYSAVAVPHTKWTGIGPGRRYAGGKPSDQETASGPGPRSHPAARHPEPGLPAAPRGLSPPGPR